MMCEELWLKEEEKKKKKGTKNLFTLKPNFVEGGHQSIETLLF